MASLQEIKSSSLAGGIILPLTYLTLCLECSWTPQLPWLAAVSLVGGLSGLQMAMRFGSQNDTVIYYLRHRGRIVYVGIAYARRVGIRVQEHRQSGKHFDRVDIGRPRPRAEALKMESKRIRKLQPRYNLAGK
ncbi:MAG: hypothetical protein H6581_22790 [Bacteroidia bacterium]|nr:hypothetical protein [Bacteroidia bacterium]